MCYFCGNYCKPITVQYYIASCVSSVPRLTLMDLNWTYEHALGMKLVCVRVLTYCSYLTEFLLRSRRNAEQCVYIISPSPHDDPIRYQISLYLNITVEETQHKC